MARPTRLLARTLSAALTVFVLRAGAEAADVKGRVEMPEACATAVSPAVVHLEPVGSTPPAASPGDPKFIDQVGMRFAPRVVALRAGQVLRFGNADSERHNIHIRAPGVDFNRVVAPGETTEFVPSDPGVLKVLCDIHSHMRAFVVVADSPWVSACGRDGRFRFRDVPEGRYRLLLWHELGSPLETDVVVRGTDVDLGTLVATEGTNAVTAADRGLICKTGCEPWPLVIDRMSVTLAASLEAARRPSSAARAGPLARVAYHRDFEASGLKKAIRLYLGEGRATAIADEIRAIGATTEGVAEGRANPDEVHAPTRRAVLDLSRAAAELDRKGVTERSRILAGTSPAFWVEESPAGPAGDSAPDRELATAFVRAEALASSGHPAEAASALADGFRATLGTPRGRALRGHDPGATARLQGRLNALRGEVRGGLSGPALAAGLRAFRSDLGDEVQAATGRAASGFVANVRDALALPIRDGSAAVALLAVLGSILARSGPPRRSRPLALGAGLGALAGLAAVSLGGVLGDDGRLPGGLMLAASCALIVLGSDLAARGSSGSSRRGENEDASALAIESGLAASLMVACVGAGAISPAQSLLSGPGAPQARAGAAAGLALGLVALVGLHRLVRRLGDRLSPLALRWGACAVVLGIALNLAGRGVFSLQSGRAMRTTGIDGLGPFASLLGFPLSLEAVVMQGVLAACSIPAVLLMARAGPGHPLGWKDVRPSGPPLTSE